jgi:hypothetical protein
LTRSARWYEALVARLGADYEYAVLRLAHWCATSIWKLRERLTYDREQLTHAVYGLRALLADGPVPGKEVRRWLKKAGVSRSLAALARKILGVRISSKPGQGDVWQLEPPGESTEAAP